MSAPGKHNFIVYQGSTWDEEIVLNNADGTPMNLTGMQARMQLREEFASPSFILALDGTNGRLTVSDAVGGRLRLLVAALDTAALPLDFEPKVYLYDLELFRPLPEPEYVRKVLAGRVKCFPEITRV
ncbi:MAG: hypothetical protein DDT39_00004 [Firmicutes bacterium]|nr:hypothetical protein [candidate division NPL-UPA2 bacterium]